MKVNFPASVFAFVAGQDLKSSGNTGIVFVEIFFKKQIHVLKLVCFGGYFGSDSTGIMPISPEFKIYIQRNSLACVLLF